MGDDMRIKFKNSSFPKNKKRKIINKIKRFMKKEDLLDICDQILLDWTPSKTVNLHGGYYGGFLSLYQDRKVYINLTVFYELENLNNTNEILWAIFHELIHVKQMYSKEIIISKDANSLTYKGQVFNKLNFRGSTFLELYKDSRFQATEYHISEIPWEGECYYKSDIYTGIQSFNHNILKKAHL